MTDNGPGAGASAQLQALKYANHVRRARADLKRQIAGGAISAADVILTCPQEATRWSVQDLLMSQQYWGHKRCRTFLDRNQIGELKLLGELTERQRQLLADQLDARSRNAAGSSQTRERTLTRRASAPLESLRGRAPTATR